ncbi:protease [Pedobacter jamesrossensis]|uniref:Protease n=1 Tax=Pedobacter jamesrossensis TaxID=1908238 RepID=A0ABV8NQ91_9SPHI
MKNTTIIASVCLLLSACSSSSRLSENGSDSDSTAKEQVNTQKPTTITGKMFALPTAKVGDSVKIRFTVYNETDSTRQFCKWHTPFEPLLSKYLDITADEGTEAPYKGPMAKRVMPPPADSYVSLKSGDSLVSEINVLKGYDFSKPGKYTIKYNAANMSGIVVKDSIILSLLK